MARPRWAIRLSKVSCLMRWLEKHEYKLLGVAWAAMMIVAIISQIGGK